MTRSTALLGAITFCFLIPAAASAQSFLNDSFPRTPNKNFAPFAEVIPVAFLKGPDACPEACPSDGRSAPCGSVSEGVCRLETDPCCQISCEDKSWTDWLAEKKDRAWDDTCDLAGLIRDDYKNFYSCDNFFRLGVAFAITAPLANTPVDQNFRDWYQRDVRSSGSDDFSSAMKPFGEYYYTIPVFVTAALAGRCFDDTPCGSCVHDWGQRSLRALAVGAPAVGVMQVVVGSSRPGEGGSYWRPFHDENGVSGHAFVGSIPFLTAASMTENRLCRYTLIAASALPAWSRINDDAHYLSQAALGWCMGCAAVLSVNETEWQRHGVQVLPVTPNGEPGVGVMIQY